RLPDRFEYGHARKLLQLRRILPRRLSDAHRQLLTLVTTFRFLGKAMPMAAHHRIFTNQGSGLNAVGIHGKRKGPGEPRTEWRLGFFVIFGFFVTYDPYLPKGVY